MKNARQSSSNIKERHGLLHLGCLSDPPLGNILGDLLQPISVCHRWLSSSLLLAKISLYFYEFFTKEELVFLYHSIVCFEEEKLEIKCFRSSYLRKYKFGLCFATLSGCCNNRSHFQLIAFWFANHCWCWARVFFTSLRLLVRWCLRIENI